MSCSRQKQSQKIRLSALQYKVEFTEGFTRMTWFLLSLWFVTTIIDKHTDGTRGLIYLHTHINIYWHHLLCAHPSYLLHWINNFVTQNFSSKRSTMPLLFKNYSLVEVIHQLIGFNKTKSFLWNIKKTDGNGIDGQNMYTPHTERKITLERAS